jgi:hypothetical protein
MAYFVKNAAPAPDPKIWDELKACSDGLGGGVLAVTELDATKNGGKLLKGAPLYLDYATKMAHVIKAATVITGGTTTAARVNKNHLFVVGDASYVSGDAVAITAIDATNAAYDVITFSAPNVGAAAGAIIIHAAAAGATPVVKYSANCLLGNSTKIIAGETVTCIIDIDQWVPIARFPHTISALTVTALYPNIILK